MSRTRIVVFFILFTFVFMGSLPLTVFGASEDPPRKTGRDRLKDLVVTGKLYYSRKNMIGVPYSGNINSIKAESGQAVEAGQVLATYTLNANVALDLLRKLSPFALDELKVKLVTNRAKLNQLREGRKYASVSELDRIDSEIKVTEQENTYLEKRLDMEGQFFERFRVIVQGDLKVPVKAYEVPQECTLTAGLTGHIINVHSELRIGKGFNPGDPIFMVGVMDPMLLRAQVHELEAVALKVGDIAYFVLESIPDRVFEAKVSHLSWTPTTQEIDQPSYYGVEFEVPNPDLVLKEGFRGKVFFSKPGSQ